ncbi:hypothetical protein AB5J72_07405 [Streptomyces sp. CG1]|uniref:hypothetical protein n=1 Tax=Streptomyces sp. CG1 TaxID=1287523 RepID=UPI0034E29552
MRTHHDGWRTWQGHLLGPLGLGGRTGVWACANLGVLVAPALAFLGTLLTGRGRVSAQEAREPGPVTDTKGC